MASFGECNAECFPPTGSSGVNSLCAVHLFIRPTFSKQWKIKLHGRIVRDNNIGADSCLFSTEKKCM